MSDEVRMVRSPEQQQLAQAITMLRPIVKPSELLAGQEETRQLVADGLKEGRDWGNAPGTDKPTLFKAGAERVALAFGCYFGEPEIVEREIDHDREVPWRKRSKVWVDGAWRGEWKETTGTSLGLYRYVMRVPVINRATGQCVGFGIGSASTMESKYVDRPRECENTIVKMAHKRGAVSAALIAFGLSDQFTQDMEDVPLAGAGQASAVNDETEGRAPKVPPPSCPGCGGPMFDNRDSKRNPRAPDFKCKKNGKKEGEKKCEGCYWPGEWPPKPTEAEGEQRHPPQDKGGENAGAPSAEVSASAGTYGTSSTETGTEPASASRPSGADVLDWLVPVKQANGQTWRQCLANVSRLQLVAFVIDHERVPVLKDRHGYTDADIALIVSAYDNALADLDEQRAL